MKHNFMNKENGKVASVLVMYLDDEGHMQIDSYDKVEDLMEDYAAYKPAEPEPLIKDEKIRKAVRAWAEALGANKVSYMSDIYSFWSGSTCIEFDRPPIEPNLDKTYTITELCGEEEE